MSIDFVVAAVAAEPWARHIWHRDPRFGECIPTGDSTVHDIATSGRAADRRFLWDRREAFTAAVRRTRRLLVLAEADERLVTEPTRYGMRIATAGDSHDLMILYPKKAVQFNLRRISDAGLDDEATELHRLFTELDERPAAVQHPFVRWEKMQGHWDRFETDVLSVFIDAHLAALATRTAEPD